MSFLKRWKTLWKPVSLTNDVSLAPPSFQLSEEEWQKQGRILRKLALQGEQLLQLMDQCNQSLSVLLTEQRSHSDKSEVICLEKADFLQVFGITDRMRAAVESPLGIQLIQEMEEFLCKKSGLQPSAAIGALYDSETALIRGTIPLAGPKPGTVQRILQQGYRDRSGRLLRQAQVIVSISPKDPAENQQRHDAKAGTADFA